MKLEKLIAKNVKEQNPHLDLSGKKLTGSEPALQELAGCTHITSLDISRNHIYDAGFLQGLPALKSLSLVRNKYAYMNFLEGNLPATLEKLDLEGIGLAELPPLGDLPALKCLDLRYNALSDLEAVGAYTTLEKLYFHTNAVADLSPLSGLTRLRILEFPRNKVKDISPLAELEHLEVLSMESNRIREVVLRDMPRLRKLAFEHNQTKRVVLRNVGVEDLHVKRGGDIELGDLPNLQELKLSHYGDAPLPRLYALPNLRSLHLHKAKTGNLRFLLALPMVSILRITKCYVSFDVNSFAPLSNLSMAYLEKEAAHLLQNMPNLCFLELSARQALHLEDIPHLAFVPHLKRSYVQECEFGIRGALYQFTTDGK